MIDMVSLRALLETVIARADKKVRTNDLDQFDEGYEQAIRDVLDVIDLKPLEELPH